MRRGPVIDQRAEDLQAFRVDPGAAAAWLAAEDGEDQCTADPTQAGGPPLEIWPENHQILRLWMALVPRWLRDIDGRPLALSMTETEALMRLLGLRRRKRLVRQLLEMESAALEVLEEAS